MYVVFIAFPWSVSMQYSEYDTVEVFMALSGSGKVRTFAKKVKGVFCYVAQRFDLYSSISVLWVNLCLGPRSLTAAGSIWTTQWRSGSALRSS